ncbi:amidase domain-containing protein [Agromyces sp. MMS24-JH15]|uniref:amidase domain-containing protein n=1 Tax=Agromyces sp. MMS24-JH15 TaxID=3243765 RepID=UPI0037483D69
MSTQLPHQPDSPDLREPGRTTLAERLPADPADQAPGPAPRRAGAVLAVAAAATLAAAGLATGALALGAALGGQDATTGASDAVAGGTRTTASDGASGAAADVVSAPVAAQLAWAQAHWQDTDSAEFGYLEESDCVNFASQSLLARGWTTDDEWWYEPGDDAYAHSEAWISSTAFRDYLEAHPERATALTDDQRAQVKVGDIVQFDWDDSGDRDHTGIVTAVIPQPDGTISIEYAGHTDATWDRTVDQAIHEIHPGGVATYWSIPE